ncbi:PKD-like family lipoprotein [Solitalea koreensis]|uniref:PKD-like family protein n=1 Tax=Solitalea koreensis TaxID=543615 RepID=A0A521AV77_9SPHI|nr:PKD-like family lipoprotein [Solitalea koreensis]SMO38748.1 PKD-like family protein [Solitalea koreensis]
MKKLYTIAVSLMVLGCTTDKGKFDYAPNEIITIKGIEDSYTKISEFERITLDPVVTSTDKNADFEYTWGMYETGVALKLDTIAKTKALDYLIKQPAKGWVLVFKAKNKHTGLSQFFSSNIEVTTQFTRGWYVAKDDGSQTDVDLFKTPVNIVPDGKVENVYSFVNGKKIPGKASLFSFAGKYKSTVTGVLADTRSLFVLTDKDASVVDINTLKEIRDLDRLFYAVPSTKAPLIATAGNGALYFVNDGGVHTIASATINSGQFGAKRMKDDLNTPYKVSKYFMTSNFNNPIFFDEETSSFISCTAFTNSLTAIPNYTPSKLSVNNNNKQLLYMGIKTPSPYLGYAVLQDKTKPSMKVLYSINAANLSAFNITVIDTIRAQAVGTNPASKMYNASNFTLLQGDENLLYFTAGNEVWSRNLSNKAERLQYTVPAGEVITYIRHRKYTGTGAEAPYSYNYVMIGTKIGANYKVRMFTKSSSGDLTATPAFTLDGTGSVGDVIYVSPLVNKVFDDTYINSF